MKLGPIICYRYPVGGLAFKVGQFASIQNVKFIIGIMTKKSFLGFIRLQEPKTISIPDELDNLKAKE